MNNADSNRAGMNEDAMMDNNTTLIPEEWGTEQEEKALMGFGPKGMMYIGQNFDSAQLSEIRQGLEEGLDVSLYATSDYTWFQMEELRKGLKLGYHIDKFLEKGFDWMQISEIRKGLETGIDISYYANTDFFFLQMEQIRLGLEDKLPVSKYAKTEYDHLVMREIRKALTEKIDLMPYVAKIKDGAVLREIRIALKHNVNIFPYALHGYSNDQLEEICIAKENKIPIEKYLKIELYGTQIRQIRLGVQSEVRVELYATGEYNWMQMREIRLGLEEHLEVELYRIPYMTWRQMEQIRLGLEQYLDVKSYATVVYNADEMQRRRLELIKEQEIEDKLDTCGAETEVSTVNVNIVISANKMQASVQLLPPPEGEVYKKKQIVEMLRQNGVIQGINDKLIQKLVREKIYYQPTTVAQGRERTDGEDGYFTFLFRTKMPVVPHVNDDGSVNFHDMDLFEQVKKGQKLAVYTPATAGQYGYNIMGELLVPKKGREQHPLRGEGFILSEDRTVYTASIDGKVEVVNGEELKVSRMLVVHGNLDYAVGNINFDGDVHIQGDVRTGFAIVATGNVQVSGHVEDAIIKAGGDIVIQQGMNGREFGKIEAGGEIGGSYFETTNMRAGGLVRANYIMNCKVYTEDRVVVSGRQSVIVGGKIKALHGIEATDIGNAAQVPTYLYIGVTEELMKLYQDASKQMVKVNGELTILLKGKSDLEKTSDYMQPKAANLYAKIQQAIVMKQEEMVQYETERNRLSEKISGANYSKIVVKGKAYAGITVKIDMRSLNLLETVTNVYFALLEDHIGIVRLR